MSAVLLHCCKSPSLLCGSHSTRAVPHQVCVDPYNVCGHCICVSVVCYDTRACVQVREGLCSGVLEPHVPSYFLFFVCSLCLLLLLPYHAVCITPSLKLSSSLLRGSHGTIRTASLCGLLLTYYACVDIAYACVLCVLWECV